MSQDLYQQLFKNAFSEIVEVVRTVDVIVDACRYRIEIVKACHEPQVWYQVQFWFSRDVNLQPMHQQGGKESDEADSIEVLAKHPYVWIRTDDPESALKEALTFLAEGNKG